MLATRQPDIRTMGGKWVGPGRSGQPKSICDCQMANDLSGGLITASIPVSRTYQTGTFPDWHGSPHKAVGFPEADLRKKAGTAFSKRKVKNGKPFKDSGFALDSFF